jgi:hypothetical protein
MSEPKERQTGQPDNTTPGRPKEQGSRQQTHPDQGHQTGSHKTDHELANRKPK